MPVSRLNFSSVHEIRDRHQRRWRVVRRRLRRLRQWPHRMSYELSYAKPDDPPIRRWFMRAMEDLSGRRRLLPLYRRWRNEVAGGSTRMWSQALELIGTHLEIGARGDWHRAIPPGPLVIIANHPFGIADGIAALALAERLGRPYRILLTSEFMRVPELRGVGLPIDFSETKEALATNIETRVEARRLLKEGGIVVIFPAGAVATADNPFGKAEERPWRQFVVRLIQQSNAAVLPVFIEGQNSPLFHFVSRYSQTLRLSLLVCEFRHKIGSTIRVTVGAPLASRAIASGGNRVDILDELYLLVHRLAQGASAHDRTALLPRPPHLRRWFPCDPPREVPRPRQPA
jgi:putative hemolysin